VTEPGGADLYRAADGTVTVQHADPLIRVARELLDHPDQKPWMLDDTGVLQLDTAGEYRYRHVRNEDEDRAAIYERITE